MADIVFVDVETGGLDPDSVSLLTVGLVTLDLKSGEVTRPLLVRVRNDPYRVSAEALAITGIDLTEHHGRAAEPEHAANEVRAYLQYRRRKRAMIGGHNVQFDLRFLPRLLPDWHALVLGGVVDTKTTAQFLIHAGLLPKRLPTRLEDLAGHFGIEFRAHDALQDARATARVYWQLLRLTAQR